MAALTGAAGVIAVKRIFQQLSDGTLVLPDTPEPISQSASMIIDPPETSQSSTVTSEVTPLSNLSLQSGSIAHFLRAHPNPLTEGQLVPLCIHLWPDFITLHGSRSEPSSIREGFADRPQT
jgi:ribosome biogenesis ATPase